MTDEKSVDQFIAEQMQKLADNPDCANTHYNLGLGYLAKRMFREAEECLLKAVDSSPKLVEAYVQLGGIAMQRGDLAGCKHYNEMAAKIMPLFAVPWANIGYVHMQLGESDEAIAAFKKALKRDPNFVQALANMGGILFMRGELDDSIAYSKKAVGLAPDFGPAYNNLALAYMEKGDTALAVENLEKAIGAGFQPPEGLLQELAPHRAGGGAA